MDPSRWRLPLGAFLVLGCSPTASPAEFGSLRLSHIRPSNPDGVFLNEEILFYFDGELDPASVTSGSIEILSEAGRPARGELRVESDHVRFVPAPVLAADLSDGGYLPGTSYRVTLAGFPRPDGLRGTRGAFLPRTVTWDFRTVRVAHPRTSLVFEDRMQHRSGLLRLFPSAAGQGGLIRPQDSIYLACDKPIDPSTVQPGAFVLTNGRAPLAPTEDAGLVQVRVRVVENDAEVRRRPRPSTVRSSAPPEAWDREPRAALVELTPELRLAAGSWIIRSRPEPGDSEPLLRDFGGRPVVIAGPDSTFNILVVDPSAETGRGELREEFQSRSLLSPVAVPDFDGTAFWSDSGRVELRFPAAAGSGADGHVALGEREHRVDMNATTIDLAKGVECKLPDTPGLVVLRCQGRMTIRGTLRREAPWDPKSEAQRDPTLYAWARTRTGSQTLSSWLAGQRARDGNWTVLVAGGDLEIEGALDSTTPLLLVAGGRIRVPGTVHGGRRAIPAPPEDASAVDLEVGGVYLLREGGGYGISPDPTTAPLVADEPQGENPLQISLRFAALSGPIPQSGEVLRWLQPEFAGSSGGTWRVRFLSALGAPPRSLSELKLADSPAFLEPPGPVQFLIELEVTPGGTWNPPWVDYVQLAWERQPPRTGPGGDDR